MPLKLNQILCSLCGLRVRLPVNKTLTTVSNYANFIHYPKFCRHRHKRNVFLKGLAYFFLQIDTIMRLQQNER